MTRSTVPNVLTGRGLPRCRTSDPVPLQRKLPSDGTYPVGGRVSRKAHRSRRVAPDSTKKQPVPLHRRTVVWLAGILVVALTGAMTTLITEAIGTGAKKVRNAVVGSPSATPDEGPVVSVSYGSPTNDACSTGLNWAFPKAADQLAPLPGSRDEQLRFAAANGGVPTAGTVLTLTVQGRDDRTVVLTGLRAKALTRRPAVTGTAMATLGCGGVSPRWFAVDDLDADPIRVIPQDGQDAAGNEIPAVSFPYQVSASDVEVFELAPLGHLHDVDWIVEIDWASAGRTGELVVNDHGKPFRFTGGSAAKPYYFDPRTRKWTSASQPR